MQLTDFVCTSIGATLKPEAALKPGATLKAILNKLYFQLNTFPDYKQSPTRSGFEILIDSFSFLLG